MIGKRILLTAEITPAAGGETPTADLHHIPGETEKNYTTEMPMGSAEDVSRMDMRHSDAYLTWIRNALVA